MKIAIIGCGYVGTVTGAGFAELEYDVILVDIDENKVNLLNLAQSPIFVPGLEEIIKKIKSGFTQLWTFGRQLMANIHKNKLKSTIDTD